MTTESENKLLARRLLEEVANTGAVGRLPEFLAPEFVAHGQGNSGIDEFRQHALTFRQCYPDMVVTVEGQVAENDIVVTWYVMRGTHLGAFGGVPATGKRITLRGSMCRGSGTAGLSSTGAAPTPWRRCLSSGLFAGPAEIQDH